MQESEDYERKARPERGWIGALRATPVREDSEGNAQKNNKIKILMRLPWKLTVEFVSNTNLILFLSPFN